MICVYCGQLHPIGSAQCPNTGRPLPPAAGPVFNEGQQPAGGGYVPQAGQGQAPGAGGYGGASGQAVQSPPPAGFGQAGGGAGYGQASPYGQQAGGPGAPGAGYGQASPYGQQAGAPGAPGARYGQAPYGQQAGGGYGQLPGYGQSPGGSGYGQAPGYRPQVEGGFARQPGLGDTSARAKPIGALLTEAFDLYKKNFVAFFLICAVLFVPLSGVSVMTRWLVTLPAAAAVHAADQGAEAARQAAADMQRALQEKDPRKRAELIAEQQKRTAEALRTAQVGVGAAATGIVASLLAAALAGLEILVLYSLIIPLTHAAVTVGVLDGATGGLVSAARSFNIMFRRFGGLLGTGLLSALTVTLGVCACVLPGLVLGFLFALCIPVVLIEKKSGVAALKRSYQLVTFDWVYVLIVFIVFGVIHAAASFVGRLAFGWTGILIGGLASSMVEAVCYPFSAIATVLAYIEIRRRKEGIDLTQLKAGLEAPSV